MAAKNGCAILPGLSLTSLLKLKIFVWKYLKQNKKKTHIVTGKPILLKRQKAVLQ